MKTLRRVPTYPRQQYKNVQVNKEFIELRVQITRIHRNHNKGSLEVMIASCHSGVLGHMYHYGHVTNMLAFRNFNLHDIAGCLFLNNCL